MYPYNIDKPIQKATPEGRFPQPFSTDERLMDLLLIAMQQEADEAAIYKRMSDDATDEENRDILRSMYLDESRHNILLRELYTELSGVDAPPIVGQDDEEALSYTDELKRNVLIEIEAARFYRDLAMLFNDPHQHNIIMGILEDEQNHSVLNIYLIVQ